MPHLVMLYSQNVEALTNLDVLCRQLCDAMLAVRDENGAQVFPTGGTRVLAFPAAHHAVADGAREYLFLYLNVRMAKGRSAPVHKAVGEAVAGAARAHLQPLYDTEYIGMTVQIDEGHEVFDAKLSTIHPLFAPGGAPKGPP
jgi:5-carboxymethyl-2-hydroxymuconate isomerase